MNTDSKLLDAEKQIAALMLRSPSRALALAISPDDMQSAAVKRIYTIAREHYMRVGAAIDPVALERELETDKNKATAILVAKWADLHPTTNEVSAIKTFRSELREYDASWKLHSLAGLAEKSPAEALAEAGRLAKSLPTADEGTVTGTDELLAAIDDEAAGRGMINLPWSILNKFSCALLPRTLTIVAGPAGSAKTWLALLAGLHCHQTGIRWAYLPLEDSRADVARRYLCALTHSWKPADRSATYATHNKQLLLDHKAEIDSILTSVAENPRSAHKANVDVTPEYVLTWVEQQIDAGVRLIVIDPLAQINFGNDKTMWDRQRGFVRDICAALQRGNATLMLVAHSKNRAGAAGKILLTMEDLQGVAELNRLAHTVIMVDAHEQRESNVLDLKTSMTMPITHTHTVAIAKARNGEGRCRYLAYTFGASGPEFSELGFIVPKRRAI